VAHWELWKLDWAIEKMTDMDIFVQKLPEAHKLTFSALFETTLGKFYASNFILNLKYYPMQKNHQNLHFRPKPLILLLL